MRKLIALAAVCMIMAGYSLLRAGDSAVVSVFHSIDRDADGKVTAEEYLIHWKGIAKDVDKNADGVIGADEVSARAAAHHKQMDVNGDGKLDKTEYIGLANKPETAPAEKAEEAGVMFEKYDADNDSVIIIGEYFVSRSASFVKADADKDGSVSVEEITAYYLENLENVKKRSGKADDDKVTVDEWIAGFVVVPAEKKQEPEKDKAE